MRRRLGWLAVIVFAAILLTYRLGAKDIWLDEAASWDTATRPVAGVIEQTAQDIHPPLYYLLLKGWIHIWGDSLVSLRSLSVLSGLAALWLMLELGAALTLSNGVLLAAVAWCALSPHTVFYDQEARMYPLLTALVTGACLCYRRWIDSLGQSRRALIVYVLCAVTALYVHYFASLVLAAIACHSLLVLGRHGSLGSARRSRMDWALANAAIVIGYGAWAPTAIAQIARGQAWRASVGASDLPRELSLYVRQLLFGNIVQPDIGSVVCLSLVGILAMGLLGTAIRARRRSDERGWFLAAVAILPSAAALALLPRSGHLELPRYLEYALPLALLAVAYGLPAWRLPQPLVAALLIMGALAPISFLQNYFAASATDYDTRPIVSFLTEVERLEPDARSPVYVAPGYVSDVLRYWTRSSIDYVRVNTPATAEEIVLAAAAAAKPPWVVVDYRSAAIETLDADPRLIRVPVPDSTSSRIAVYRWVGQR
jgi:uncharacterized membrane protein